MPTSIPTVFIPALLCDERLYSDVIADLGEQIDAQIMMSPKPALADSVADILGRAPENFVLVSASYGGRLALEIALAAPERVTALWVMGSDPGAAPPDGVDLAGKLESAPDEAFAMLAGMMFNETAVSERATFMDMARSVGVVAGVAQARAVGGRSDITNRLGELEMPVLALWGEDDKVSPLLVARKLAAALPNARLQLLPGCGHLPTLEKPAESAAAFVEFLRGVTAS